MSFNENSPIKTIEDVVRFAHYLYRDLRVSFHPDDDFADYVNFDTGEPTFTNERASLMNERMEECFRICDDYNTDIYKLMKPNNLLQ